MARYEDSAIQQSLMRNYYSLRTGQEVPVKYNNVFALPLEVAQPKLKRQVVFTALTLYSVTASLLLYSERSVMSNYRMPVI